MKNVFALLALGNAIAANRGGNSIDIEDMEDAPLLLQPNQSSSLQIGEPFEVKWAADQFATVTMILRKGTGKDMRTIATIASDIPNNGTYIWTPFLEADDEYSVMLVDWRGCDESGSFAIRAGNHPRENPDPDPGMTFAEAICRETGAKARKRQVSSSASSNTSSLGTTQASSSAGIPPASSSANITHPASSKGVTQASNSTVPLVTATVTSAIMSSVMTSAMRNITSVATIAKPLAPNGTAGGTNGSTGYGSLQQVAEASAERLEISLTLLAALLISFA